MDINLDLGTNIEVILSKLASTLGTTISHILTIYTKQAYYEGLFSLVVIGIMLITSISLFYINNKKVNWDEISVKTIICTLSGFIFVICLLVFAFAGVTWIMQIKNPEFYAIKEIIYNFKGKF